MKLKILTVLKSGGDFYPEHVYKIKEMCEEHIKDIDFSFYCFTDLDLLCNTIKLEHSWPKWWSKIEIFKEEGPCLFIDLDTIVCGDISNIIKNLKNSELCMLKDQWHKNTMGSGLVYWDKDVSYIYEKFKLDPEKHMHEYEGDQNFINHVVKEKKYIQDYCDGEIVSFKANLEFGRKFNPDLHSIVYFHGPPRPWQQGAISY